MGYQFIDPLSPVGHGTRIKFDSSPFRLGQRVRIVNGVFQDGEGVIYAFGKSSSGCKGLIAVKIPAHNNGQWYTPSQLEAVE